MAATPTLEINFSEERTVIPVNLMEDPVGDAAEERFIGIKCISMKYLHYSFVLKYLFLYRESCSSVRAAAFSAMHDHLKSIYFAYSKRYKNQLKIQNIMLYRTLTVIITITHIMEIVCFKFVNTGSVVHTETTNPPNK